jgi:hypothetical protein
MTDRTIKWKDVGSGVILSIAGPLTGVDYCPERPNAPPAKERRMTLGEYRVGITFNPGGNPRVDEIKRKAADLIDYINDRIAGDGEVLRLQALAMTHIEDAAMWAVKAETKPPRE